MKFQARQRNDGEWYWRLVGANGEIIGGSTGEGYKRRKDCLDAIALVQGTTIETPVEIIYSRQKVAKR